MRPEEIKKLHDELDCSLGELAAAVGVEVGTLLAWEAGDLFPTRRHATKLEALRKAGPGALRKTPPPQQPAGIELLADPRLWTIVTKLVSDPAFFAEVEKLAAKR